MKKNVLVVGWYGKGNLGDQAFEEAFYDLWGQSADFVFAGQIPKNVNDYDALCIGGGSVLDKPVPSMVSPAKVTIPVGIIGVGMRTPLLANQGWVDKAKVVVVRNRMTSSSSYFCGPDLAFARTFPRIENLAPPPAAPHLLVLGNSFVVPNADSVSWHSTAFHWFQSEFALYLDEKVDQGWTVEFLPMCGPKTISATTIWDDRFFAAHVVSLMRKRDQVTVDFTPPEETKLIAAIQSATEVVSLRFHGCVFSTIVGTPFKGVSFHDKTRSFFVDNNLPNWVNYYGFTRLLLDQAPLPSATELADITQTGWDRWHHDLSGIVADKLTL